MAVCRAMSARRTLRLAAAVLAATTLAAACGDDDTASPATPTGPSVRITAPADGATVTSPVKVNMSATGFVVEPAGEVRDGAGHFHLLVDVGCLQPGTPIPLETPGYHHFGKAQTEAELELAPGEHEICLQAGNGAHIALDLTDTITIEVA